ncbi:MAG TPA: ABC transporter permease subunit [Candidatus Limnocylindrales bacterium]|nr:ABC transporter permease subunit [Candidatus Limnocylindrales bacterium]
MIGTTFRLELRRSRSLAFWLAVIAGAYAGTMAVFYPLMKENAALFEDYMDIFPEEFMAAFGMTGSLGDPGVFFTTYIGSYVWPIVAAIAGIILATRPVAADHDRGFLDLPLSTPIARVPYLGSAIVVQILVMIVVAVAMVVGAVAVGALVNAGFDAGRLFLVVPSSAAFGCAIAGVASVLAVVTLSRGMAGGITAGVLFLMYLANVVATIEPDVEWLATFSAFNYYDTTALIDEGTVPLLDLGVFTVVAVVGWIGALVLFRRRDLAA